MKNIDWQKVINKSWYYTKIFFICSAIILGAYGYGTFNPNEYAEKKIFKIAENDYLVKVKRMELVEPSMEYTNDVQFVRALHRCIDYINFTLPHSKRVPFEMIIGQAALESGWGSSRFAQEGNNLFGIRTYDPNVPGLTPLGNTNANFKVKSYLTVDDSVADYILLLNTHYAYEDLRIARAYMSKRFDMDVHALADTLLDYSELGSQYIEMVHKHITNIERILDDIN